MNIHPKIGALIGFAAKSNKLLLGSYSVEYGIKTKKAKVVILAEDVSLRRREKLLYWCQDMGIPFLTMGNKEEYGKLLRKKPVSILAVTDEKMAEAICLAAESCGGDD